MITLKELNPKQYYLTTEQGMNLAKLLKCMNVIREAYGKPMNVNSGFRSREDQAAVYAHMGIPPKWGSAHLSGQACDISDKDGALWQWCMDHQDLLRKTGLYLESRSATPTWVHFQIRKPPSGNLVFKP